MPSLRVKKSIMNPPTLERQARLLDTGKYSDLTIVCHGKGFKLHKAIVCEQSRPLAAAVDGPFLEATLGVITLDDDELDAFELLVEFLYKESYNDAPKIATATAEQASTPESASAASQGLITNVKVYVLAEKYDIPALKEYAAAKYEKSLPEGWNSEAMTTSLKILYENTPESERLLKEIALQFAAKHVQELLDRGEFYTLCQERNDICLDLLKQTKSISKTCPHCERADFVRPESKSVIEAQSALFPKRKHSTSGERGHYRCENCKINFD